MKRLVLKPENNAAAVNLETWGPMSSAQDHWKAFIEGKQAFRAGLDDTTGIFTLGNASQAQAIKPSTGVGCDVNILQGNNSHSSERVSINLCASPTFGGGPILAMALTDITARIGLRRNNTQVTLPTSLELQCDDATKLELVSDGIKIGSGSTISKHLSATMMWDPANLPADGDVTAVNVAVTGAAVGDTVAVGFPCGNNNVLLTGHVSEANTVRVVLMNKTGGSLDLVSGNLRVDIWKH
jgi:hypothetical protein